MGIAHNTQKHVVVQTTNNKEVYVCLTQGPLSVQVGRNPHLLRLASEVLAKQTLSGQEVVQEYDLGRDIGYSEILETTQGDAVFYAKIARTPYFTRFVKHRKNDQTSTLSLQLVADDDGNYELQNIWVGSLYPPSPDSIEQTSKSSSYWENHAVVYNGQSILSSTITKECPY